MSFPQSTSASMHPLKTAFTPDEPTTTHGYRLLTSSEKVGLTLDALINEDANDDGRLPHERIGYLQGLRGLVAIQMTLWCFFILFAPAAATAYDLDGTSPARFLDSSPLWQSVLRKLLSPLLWDGSLQATFYIILSGRVVVQTFLERRTAPTLAGSIFRRPFRLFLPLLFAWIFVTVLLYVGAFSSAARLSQKLENSYAAPPKRWESVEQAVNAFIGLAFDTTNSKTTRAVDFMPVRGTWWIFPRLFQQSFTAYILAIVLPFTVRAWKLTLFIGMLLATYWLGLFAWYTVTGLAVAELVVVYDLPSLASWPLPLLKSKDGSSKPRLSVPLVAIPSFLLATGIIVKYALAFAPSHRDDELIAHTSFVTGGLNRDFDAASTAYPRLDDWMVATGVLTLLEMSGKMRSFFDNAVLRWWGRNSLLLFLLVPPILLSFGSFLYVSASRVYPDASPARLLCLPFFLALPIALVVVELAYWLVERPAIYAARRAWLWFKA